MNIQVILLHLDLRNLIQLSKFNKRINELYHNEQFWKLKCMRENIVVSMYSPFETYLVNKYVAHVDDYWQFNKIETIQNTLLTYVRIEQLSNKSVISSSYLTHGSYPSQYYYINSIRIEHDFHLRPKDIARLVNMSDLLIIRNRFTKLISKEICNLSKLEVLRLDCCIIYEIPNEISDLKMLKTIAFYNCYIGLTEYDFKKLNLTKVKFYNSLVSLESFKHLTDLRELKVNKHSLREIPNIFNLHLLTHLNLSHNCIITISTQLFDLKNLEALFFTNNKIIHIPKEISKLTKLKTLDIGSNCIKDLPDEIILLKDSLQRLDMHDNLLREIPIQIYSLNNLESLSLYDNNLIYCCNDLKNFLRKLETIM
jgi:hypothetical protein